MSPETFSKVARRSVQEEDGLKLLQLRSEGSAQRRTNLGHDLMVHPSRLASLHYDIRSERRPHSLQDSVLKNVFIPQDELGQLRLKSGVVANDSYMTQVGSLGPLGHILHEVSAKLAPGDWLMSNHALSWLIPIPACSLIQAEAKGDSACRNSRL